MKILINVFTDVQFREAEMMLFGSRLEQPASATINYNGKIYNYNTQFMNGSFYFKTNGMGTWA